MTTTFRMREAALHIDGIATIGHHRAESAFWSDTSRTEFRSGHILSVFDYTETWDYHERHPDGEELAILLDGSADLLLAEDEEDERRETLTPGSACIIPRGTWHRLSVHEPCTVLFITPVPANTEHRTATTGAGSAAHSS